MYINQWQREDDEGIKNRKCQENTHLWCESAYKELQIKG